MHTTHPHGPQGWKTAVGVLIVAVLTAGCASGAAEADGPSSTSAADGVELSEFHQMSLVGLDGSVINFSDYVGTPVLLNFFASWCAPCRAEMPTLEALHNEWDGQVAVIGLNSVEGVDAAQGLVDDTGITFMTALDHDGVLFERYEALALPTNVFIDGQGNVVDTWGRSLSETEFRDLVRDLFGVV
jgi:thiol-disulfide isomerase/thioredoxin